MELPPKAFRKVIKEDDEEVFNDEELEKLLTYLSAAPDILNLGITLMFCTGCRVRELVAIKWSDVLGNSIKIRRTEITYKNDIGEIIFEIRDYPKTEAGIRKKFPHKLQKHLCPSCWIMGLIKGLFKMLPVMRKYLQAKGIITVIESPIKEKKKYLVSYRSSRMPNQCSDYLLAR